MRNIFIESFQKNKVLFGIVSSPITSIIIINTMVDYSNIIVDDFVYLLLTLILAILFFIWYVLMIKEGGRNER